MEEFIYRKMYLCFTMGVNKSFFYYLDCKTLYPSSSSKPVDVTPVALGEPPAGAELCPGSRAGMRKKLVRETLSGAQNSCHV